MLHCVIGQIIVNSHRFVAKEETCCYNVFHGKSHARHFRALSGTCVVDCVQGSDEAGFLHVKELTREVETGLRSNRGSHDDCCKDTLISLVVIRRK